MKERMNHDWNAEVLTAEAVPYTRPQPEGLVAVREYRFVAVGGVRCVLLNWAKEAEFSVDSFTFDLEEMDAAGTCIHRTRVTYGASDIADATRRETFIPSQGIPVSDPCVEVCVRLISLTSEGFRYRVSGERVLVDYDTPEPWLYDEKGGQSEELSDDVPLRVLSGRRKKAKLLWPAGVLFVAAVLAALLLPFFAELFRSFR